MSNAQSLTAWLPKKNRNTASKSTNTAISSSTHQTEQTAVNEITPLIMVHQQCTSTFCIQPDNQNIHLKCQSQFHYFHSSNKPSLNSDVARHRFGGS